MAVRDRDTEDLARACLIIADWNISALPLTEQNRDVMRELANRVLLHLGVMDR